MADDSIKSIQGSRNPKFNKVIEELALIHDRKGHDYGGDDPLSGFRDFGWRGIVIRIGDKYHRLKNFVLREIRDGKASLQVPDETIRDTIQDLAAYAILALILLDETQPGKEQESSD